jgi:hypothetical protein
MLALLCAASALSPTARPIVTLSGARFALRAHGALRKGAFTRAPAPVASAGILALDGLVPAFEAYSDIWTPALFSLGVPDFILHWGHGAAMFTVLAAMGGYGTYLGWQTRLGNGDDVLPLNLGKPNRAMHSTLMPVMVLMFLLGGQGGFVLLRGQGQPILESPHASTAVIGLSLLFLQERAPLI